MNQITTFCRLKQIHRLRLLGLGVINAIGGMAFVSSLTPPQSPAFPAFAEPGGMNQQQIDRLRYYATAEECSARGCTLTVNQSVKAMHTAFGIPARFEDSRDLYPISYSSDGVVAPKYVEIFYQLDASKGYADSIAYSIWVPAHQRWVQQEGRKQTIAAPIASTPSDNPLLKGMTEAEYQTKRRALQ
jgi:hypothetical protein